MRSKYHVIREVEQMLYSTLGWTMQGIYIFIYKMSLVLPRNLT
jgi:hypothetical protein